MKNSKIILNLFFKRSNSALTQHKYLTSVVYILIHEVWQNIFAVSAGYITSNRHTGRTGMRHSVKGFPFWNSLPFLCPELNIVSVLVTLQILVIFLSFF